MVNQKNAKFKIGYNIMIVALIGILLLSVIPTIFSGSSSTIIQPTLGQPEDPFPPSVYKTLTPAQQSAREQLLKQEGFSVNALATNLSKPYNIIYGSDDVLWITEREGKDIVRIDPNNGTKLSIIPVPNVHQSAGQDGLMGMAFDPNFNNTHYIYLAYTYDADSGEELDLNTKITRFTYDPITSTISKPFDLITAVRK
jgi:glucose/arabinose dehydrogenase